ncbi:MAG: GrdX family protein [Peptostreptococcus sp.]|uniref:GrdX family protein n=1 Tax=Peptostreptococcus TaxID=1257 RepID=UPI0007678A8F|nr:MULTISPECIES: GrdX family protein [Peptostreptococcus]KXB69804.1 GrdX family protein [Peptostreptococcus anaerobius]MDU1264953.1 GrdX family protein [Peptostreptococcus sp.]
MLLLTNNEKFKQIENELNSNKLNLEYQDITYIEILEKARDLIHKGYKLLTHPLYGSVKPNETLYRSVVLEEAEEFDIQSLLLIEEAIVTAEKFKKNKMTPNWTESVKGDFRVIDFDLIKKTIDRIFQ